MKPLTLALDTFQNEKTNSIGCTLPCLTLVIRALEEFQVDQRIKHCKPLVECLLDGIKTRFGNMFVDASLKLGAISDPFFKLVWLKTAIEQSDGVFLLRQEVRRRNALASRCG